VQRTAEAKKGDPILGANKFNFYARGVRLYGGYTHQEKGRGNVGKEMGGKDENWTPRGTNLVRWRRRGLRCRGRRRKTTERLGQGEGDGAPKQRF